MEFITDITEEVKKHIESVGHEIVETDSFLISEAIEKVKNKIRNKTNQKEVPQGLKYVWVNQSVGEFLNFKIKIGKLQIESLNFERIAKEITDAGVKVSYDDTMTTGAKFESYLNNLITYGEDQFYKYRRLVW
ncbi:hypothetical protein [Leptotrichia shahii]|uniref:hypothetical protein n=1 Tax=Leptotrichia shahii TaxID=157691 RepID=UPI0028D818A4|nr:hypothetical protein [Leptotrichia shahii]